MNSLNRTHRTLIKIIAIAVVCLFTINNIAWAYPDMGRELHINTRHTLQIQSMFKPILDVTGRQFDTQVRLELACILAMSLKENMVPFQDINSELDKWLSVAPEVNRDRLLDVLSNPRKEDGKTLVDLQIFDGPSKGKKFRITSTCEDITEIQEDESKIKIESISDDTKKGAGKAPAIVSKLKEMLGGDLKGKKVLELGVGSNPDHILALSSEGAEATAVDIDNEAISRLKGSLLKAGADEVKVVGMDFNQPFTLPSDQFDAIIFRNILDFVPSGIDELGHTREDIHKRAEAHFAAQRRFFGECARVLKPGGMIVAEDVAEPEYELSDSEFDKIMAEFYEIADTGKAAVDAGFRIHERGRSFEDLMLVLVSRKEEETESVATFTASQITGYSGTEYPYEGTYPLKFVNTLKEQVSAKSEPVVVVDLGCGEGQIARWMNDKGFSVLGLDINPNNIKKAKKKAIEMSGNLVEGSSAWAAAKKLKQSKKTGLVFEQADLAHGIPLPDASVDALVMHRTLSQIINRHDREFLLEEISRVLKPGGKVSYLDFRDSEPDGLDGRYPMQTEVIERLLRDGLLPISLRTLMDDPDTQPHLVYKDKRGNTKNESEYSGADELYSDIKAGHVEVVFIGVHEKDESVHRKLEELGFAGFIPQEFFLKRKENRHARLGGFVAEKSSVAVEPSRIGKKAIPSRVFELNGRKYVSVSDAEDRNKVLKERVEINEAELEKAKEALRMFMARKPECRSVMELFLELLENSPPELYSFNPLIGDLFGFASAGDNLIALQEELITNPIALFHELGEYFNKKYAISLSLVRDGKEVEIRTQDGRIVRVFLSTHVRNWLIAKDEKWDKTWKKDPHYLLRALQLELFGKGAFGEDQEDIELTRLIQKMQAESDHKDAISGPFSIANKRYYAREVNDPAAMSSLLDRWFEQEEKPYFSREMWNGVVKRAAGGSRPVCMIKLEDTAGNIIGISVSTKGEFPFKGKTRKVWVGDYMEVSTKHRGEGIGEILVAKIIERAIEEFEQDNTVTMQDGEVIDLEPDEEVSGNLYIVHPAEDEEYKDKQGGKSAKDFFRKRGFRSMPITWTAWGEDDWEKDLWMSLSEDKALELVEKVRGRMEDKPRGKPRQLSLFGEEELDDPQIGRSLTDSSIDKSDDDDKEDFIWRKSVWARENTEEEVQERIRRECVNIREQMLFMYGKLEEDHPVSVYVKELFEEGMGDDARNYHVIVAPEWNEINATALPDGTIIISGALLKFVKYRQELQAVLAHEAIHIKRNHAKVTIDIMKSGQASFADKFLRLIGVERMQEYEADLAWMIDELQARNINPLGYRVFLERMDEFQKNRSSYRAIEWQHGSLEDRALNVESLFYFIDISSLSNELGVMPEWIKGTLDEYPRSGRIELRTEGYYSGSITTEQFEEIRHDMAGKLPARQLSRAVKSVSNMVMVYQAPKKEYAEEGDEDDEEEDEEVWFEEEEDKVWLYGNNESQEDYDEPWLREEDWGGDPSEIMEGYEKIFQDEGDKEEEEDGRREKELERREIEEEYKKKVRAEKLKVKNNNKTMEILADKIDSEFFSEDVWPIPEERALARGLYYELHCGKAYLFNAKLSGKALIARSTADRKQLSGTGDFERLNSIIGDERFVSLDTTYINTEPSNFIHRLLSAYIAHGKLSTKPTKKDVREYIAFSADLSGKLDRLYKAKGVIEIDPKEIIKLAAKVLSSELPDKNKRMKAFVEEEIGKLKVGGEDKKGTVKPENRQPGKEEHAESSLPLNEKGAELSKKILDKIAFGRKYKFSEFQEIYKEITSLLKGASAKEAQDLFFVMKLEGEPDPNYDPDYDDSLTEYQKSAYNAQIVRDDAKNRLKNYVLFRFFQKLVDESKIYSGYNSTQKRCVIFGGLTQILYHEGMGWDRAAKFAKNSKNQLVLIETGQGRSSSAKDHFSFNEIDMDAFTPQTAETKTVTTIISSQDRRYLDRYLKSIEKEWLDPEYSRKEILDMYGGLMRSSFIAYSSDKTIEELRGTLGGDLFTLILVKHLARNKSWDSIFKEVEALEKIGVPVMEIMRAERAQFGVVLNTLWENLPKKPKGKELDQVKMLIPCVNDPFLRLQLQTYYYEQLWPKMDFDQKLSVLFSEDTGGLFDLRKFNQFIEEEARTKEELHRATELLKKNYNKFMNTGSREGGMAAIATTFRADPGFAQNFLLALLQSWQSDEEVKNVIYGNEYLAGLSSLQPGDRFEEEEDDEDTRKFSRRKVKHKLAISQKILRGIFLMDTASRHILLRKVLTGDRGLISNPQFRTAFLNAMLERTVKSQNEVGLRRIMRETVGAIGENPEWQVVFFALQSFLMERIGIPPQVSTPWSKIKAVMDDIYTWMGYRDSNITKVFESDTRKERTSSDYREEKCWRYQNEWLQDSEDVLRAQLAERGVVVTYEEKEVLSPLLFVIEFAQNMGALGVRFLQLLPQFLNLPEEYRDKFSRVYDAMYGQSKLPAMALLEREWPNFWDEVEVLDDRVGGGSLMTVYRIRTKDGKEEVVKVLNPNLMYHLRKNITFVEGALDKLIEKYGSKYEIAKIVISDVKKWIDSDVHFEGFLEKDKKFKANNDGFGKKEGLKYSTYVPESRAPGSKYFMREEYIEGRNLTEWDKLVEEGHDMKEIVSLLAKNYVKQFEDGLIHSDVHVGNFRVTKDNRVAILDRNYFIELDKTPGLKDLVDSLFGIIKTAMNPLAGLMGGKLTPEIFIDKLIALSDKKISDRDRKNIIKALNEYIAKIKKKDFSGTSEFLVSLRKSGLELPLEVTLIFKNINSLNQMARRAGFDTMVDAFLYKQKGIKGVLTKLFRKGPAHIGKDARLEMVAPDKSIARVIDSKGNRHPVPLEPRELMNMRDLGASLSATTGNELYYSDIIYPMLVRYARTETKEYTFRVLIEDLFAFVSPEDDLVAFYSELKGNPVAEFHEIGEYLIKKEIMTLKMESGCIAISFDGEEPMSIAPSTDTMQFIMDESWEDGWEENPHYVLRILQREMFPIADKALSDYIRENKQEIQLPHPGQDTTTVMKPPKKSDSRRMPFAAEPAQAKSGKKPRRSTSTRFAFEDTGPTRELRGPMDTNALESLFRQGLVIKGGKYCFNETPSLKVDESGKIKMDPEGRWGHLIEVPSTLPDTAMEEIQGLFYQIAELKLRAEKAREGKYRDHLLEEAEKTRKEVNRMLQDRGINYEKPPDTSRWTSEDRAALAEAKTARLIVEHNLNMLRERVKEVKSLQKTGVFKDGKLFGGIDFTVIVNQGGRIEIRRDEKGERVPILLDPETEKLRIVAQDPHKYVIKAVEQYNEKKQKRKGTSGADGAASLGSNIDGYSPFLHAPVLEELGKVGVPFLIKAILDWLNPAMPLLNQCIFAGLLVSVAGGFVMGHIMGTRGPPAVRELLNVLSIEHIKKKADKADLEADDAYEKVLNEVAECAGIQPDYITNVANVYDGEVELKSTTVSRTAQYNPWTILRYFLYRDGKFNKMLSENPPVVVKMGENYYIAEGYNVCIAATLRGINNVPAKVIDIMDRETSWRYSDLATTEAEEDKATTVVFGKMMFQRWSDKLASAMTDQSIFVKMQLHILAAPIIAAFAGIIIAFKYIDQPVLALGLSMLAHLVINAIVWAIKQEGQRGYASLRGDGLSSILERMLANCKPLDREELQIISRHANVIGQLMPESNMMFEKLTRAFGQRLFIMKTKDMNETLGKVFGPEASTSLGGLDAGCFVMARNGIPVYVIVFEEDIIGDIPRSFTAFVHEWVGHVCRVEKHGLPLDYYEDEVLAYRRSVKFLEAFVAEARRAEEEMRREAPEEFREIAGSSDVLLHEEVEKRIPDEKRRLATWSDNYQLRKDREAQAELELELTQGFPVVEFFNTAGQGKLKRIFSSLSRYRGKKSQKQKSRIIQRVLHERNKKPFTDIDDIANRIGINKGTIEAIARKIESGGLAHTEGMKIRKDSSYYSPISMMSGMQVNVRDLDQTEDLARTLIWMGKAEENWVTVGDKDIRVVTDRGTRLSGALLQILIERTVERYGGDVNELPNTIVIGMLDASPYMFEDHRRNGFIGINRAVNEIEDERARSQLILMGLFHELAHELTGRSGSDFEKEQLEHDIDFCVELLGDDKEKVVALHDSMLPLIEQEGGFLARLQEVMDIRNIEGFTNRLSATFMDLWINLKEIGRVSPRCIKGMGEELALNLARIRDDVHFNLPRSRDQAIGKAESLVGFISNDFEEGVRAAQREGGYDELIGRIDSVRGSINAVLDDLEKLRRERAFFTEEDRQHMTELIRFAKEKIQSGELDKNVPVVARLVDGDSNVVVMVARRKYDSPSKYGVNARHAEVEAIRQAEALDEPFTDWANATLYVNLAPCHNCTKTLAEFYGVKKVVYAWPDENFPPKEQTRNEATFRANNGVMVKCNDSSILREVQEILGAHKYDWAGSTTVYDVCDKMLDVEQALTEGYRRKYQEFFKEDIQVCVFEADLWREYGQKDDIEGMIFRHIEYIKQNLNPKKEYVLLIVGSDENCELAREKIVDEGIYEEHNIVLVGDNADEIIGQIGRQAKVIEVDKDKNLAIIEDSKGDVREIYLMKQDKVFLRKLKAQLHAMERLDNHHKVPLKVLVALFEELPADIYIFDEVIEDLFGFASPEDKVIAVHKYLAEDPVALMHEVMEYMVSSGQIKVRYKGLFARFLNKLGILRFAEKFFGWTGLVSGKVLLGEEKSGGVWEIQVKGEALSVALKDTENPHYLLRAVQRQVFGSMDRELTESIKTYYRANQEGILDKYPQASLEGYKMLGVDNYRYLADELRECTGVGFLARHENVYSPLQDNKLGLNFSKAIPSEIKEVTRRLRESGRDDIRILVIGAGTGIDAMTASYHARKRGFENVDVDAIDIDRDAVDNIRENLWLAGSAYQDTIFPKLVEPGKEFDDLSDSYDLILFEGPDAEKAEDLAEVSGGKMAHAIKMDEEVFKGIMEEVGKRLSPEGAALISNHYGVYERKNELFPSNLSVVPETVHEGAFVGGEMFGRVIMHSRPLKKEVPRIFFRGLRGERFGEKLTELNGGKMPRTIAVGGDSESVRTTLSDKIKMVDKDEYVVCQIKLLCHDREVYRIVVDKPANILNNLDILTKEEVVIINKFDLVFDFAVYPEEEAVFVHNISVGTTSKSESYKKLKGRGVISEVFDRFAEELKINCPGWFISSYLLEDDGAIAHLMKKHFRMTEGGILERPDLMGMVNRMVTMVEYEESEKIVIGEILDPVKTVEEEEVASGDSAIEARRLAPEKEERRIETAIRSSNRNSQNLIKGVKEYFHDAKINSKDQPIDVVVDLSLISKEDIEENAETWSYLIRICEELGNINFIFERPNFTGRGDLPAELLADIEKAAGRDEFALALEKYLEKGLMERVNVKRRENAIEIPILSKRLLEWKRDSKIELEANQYPVALEGITTVNDQEVVLRNFEAALSIGLSKAALAIARKRDSEKTEDEEKELPILRKKILDKIQKLYAVFREDVILTEKTLDNMIHQASAVRMNLAISLALPPITRMFFQKLKDHHDKMQLFLLAA
jgi:SAM-dependent methyltransferase/tRNA(Arg) A34 adenosine deaminase TadA/GNAT superfamily N-acetyltransferase